MGDCCQNKKGTRLITSLGSGCNALLIHPEPDSLLPLSWRHGRASTGCWLPERVYPPPLRRGLPSRNNANAREETPSFNPMKAGALRLPQGRGRPLHRSPHTYVTSQFPPTYDFRMLSRRQRAGALPGRSFEQTLLPLFSHPQRHAPYACCGSPCETSCGCV
ncbi:hypothetical protein VTK56DRAFT_8295 [Thermocarpiscus australiensis]